ncbi:MAG: DUF6429 family protein [Elusimicrobia bacterium]|jgi:hypothetical protein|nr:DUF6429 family protein [Elusimicrobiota bacterium]
MEYDKDKVDEMTLALFYLAATKRPGGGAKAWKAFDLETIKRLYKKGLIDEPMIKSITLNMTEEGYKKSEELFSKYFGKK